jgi:hypothetical protein
VSREGKTVLSNTNRASFDPRAFLAKVGEGKTISKYRKDQIVFSQGAVADAVFYIQKGKIKPPSSPSGARKQSSVFSGPVTLLVKGVSMVIRCE